MCYHVFFFKICNCVIIAAMTFDVQDSHTDGRGVLTVDRHQDYDLDLVHVTSAGSLLVEFHRLYDTCDTDDYLIDVSISRDRISTRR